MRGRIHSFQSLGTVDGPGLRAVVFLQGCPLRCKCCHNPDTWDFEGGTVADSEEIVQKVLKLRHFFASRGGVTLSGGEPLAQPEFAMAILKGCKENGVHTALDTSGALFGEAQKRALQFADLVLLDFKFTSSADYVQNTGMPMEKAEEFLACLSEMKKRVWLRQVVIPGLNDFDENFHALKALKARFSCIEKIELLPFRKLCLEKYERLGIPFPLASAPEPTEEQMQRFSSLLS